MHEVNVDLLIVGAGPAGLAAAIAAAEAGTGEIVLIDRLAELGGILQQCIHNGFGLRFFKEELTGPEYAQRFMDKLADFPQITIKTETMVVDIARDQRTNRVTTVNARDGLVIYNASAVILAMGCRERPRGAINTPGTRPAGIYTAGSAQRLMNVEGFLPGRRAVILGSGDIGLIMARRLTLEGIKVEAVIELMPYSSGLTRNIVQCLDDFGIPLYLGHTVTEIIGRDRVEGVVVAPVDSNRVPDLKRAFRVDCDTLVLSVGLIPENELSLQAGVELDQATGGPTVDSDYQTNVPGIFACGNVVHVHDLVDDVTEESIVAGRSAAAFVRNLRAQRTQHAQCAQSEQRVQREQCEQRGGGDSGDSGGSDVSSIQPAKDAFITIKAGRNVRSVVPQRLRRDRPSVLYIRVANPEQDVVIGAGGLRRKLRHVTPGETVRLTMAPEYFPEESQLTVTVEKSEA